MRLLKAGPLTIRDIEDDVLTEKEHLWASRKPSKRALQLAFYTGVLTVSERNGMLKTYELMTRHFGWEKPPKPASRDGESPPICSTARCARRAWSASTSICHLDAPSKAAVRRLIEARVRQQGIAAGRARRRRQAGALGAARGAGERRRGRRDRSCTSSRRSIP